MPFLLVELKKLAMHARPLTFHYLYFGDSSSEMSIWKKKNNETVNFFREYSTKQKQQQKIRNKKKSIMLCNKYAFNIAWNNQILL